VHGGAKLRAGINEHGLQVLVETSEDNEEHAKRRLDGLHAEARFVERLPGSTSIRVE
jgi:hypothetical protein